MKQFSVATNELRRPRPGDGRISLQVTGYREQQSFGDVGEGSIA